MQTVDDEKQIDYIELEIDKYRRELENILNDKSIEESYKKEILKLFREIEKDRLLIAYYKLKNQKLALYQKALDVVNKMIYVAAYAQEIGAKNISKEIIKGCSFLLIEIGICHISIVMHVYHFLKNRIEKSKGILELIEFQTKLLALDNAKQIEETIKEYGFTDTNRYFLAIICLNEQLSEVRLQLRKENKGFGSKPEYQLTKEKINQLSLSISNLIRTALNINKNIDEDQIVTLKNITWNQYKNISETIDEASFCRISYCDGVLELMSPGLPHEELSESTGEIIKEYCFQKDIKCFPIRSTTLENKKGEKGKQPDASYALFAKKNIPDIAVEINCSSGSTRDLKTYAEIEVPEVWMYDKKTKKVSFYNLEKGKYKKVKKSKFLDLLTPDVIDKLLKNKDKKDGDLNQLKKEIITFLNSHKITNIRGSSS